MFTSLEENLYKQSSDISDNNMFSLAKKHQNQNTDHFKLLFNQSLCEQYNQNIDGSYINSEFINNKHCNFNRTKYDMNFWDNPHSKSLLNSCIPEIHNINTKNKISLHPSKTVFNCSPDNIDSHGKYASILPNCNVNNGLNTRYNNHT